MASPKSILRSCSLSSKLQYGVSKTNLINKLNEINQGNLKKVENSLIEKSGDKMIIFTSAAAQASSSHQEKRMNRPSDTDIKKKISVLLYSKVHSFNFHLPIFNIEMYPFYLTCNVYMVEVLK